MLDQKCNFLKYKDFKTRNKVNTTFLRYYGVVSAVAKLVFSGPGDDEL